MKQLISALLLGILTFNVMAQQKFIQTAGHDALGDFLIFAEYAALF